MTYLSLLSFHHLESKSSNGMVRIIKLVIKTHSPRLRAIMMLSFQRKDSVSYLVRRIERALYQHRIWGKIEVVKYMIF